MIAAQFVRTLHQVYAMEYKATLETVLFDGGSIFDCEPVFAVMVELKIRRRQSAEYAHYRILIERYWQTAAWDAATSLAFSRRGKGFFLHAMVHSLKTRNLIMIDDGCESCRYTLATGLAAPLSLLYIFGSDAYGFLFAEQRKAMKFDKADPRANFGVYVGFDVIKHTVLIATAGKVWSHGVAAVNEKAIIKAAPRSHTDDYSDQVRAAFGEQTAVSVRTGETLGEVIDSSVPALKPALAPAEADAESAAPAAELPPALTRPRREPRQPDRLDPDPAVRSLAATPPGELHVLAYLRICILILRIHASSLAARAGELEWWRAARRKTRCGWPFYQLRRLTAGRLSDSGWREAIWS